MQLPSSKYLDELRDDIAKFTKHCSQFLENAAGADLEQEVKMSEGVFLKKLWADIRHHVVRFIAPRVDDDDDGGDDDDDDDATSGGHEVVQRCLHLWTVSKIALRGSECLHATICGYVA